MKTEADPLRTAQYPMRVVVRRTGLNASVLRAWERRYEAVVPGRSKGGQRLYSEADIRRLTLLAELVEGGHNISQVAGRSTDELRQLLLRDQRSERESVALAPGPPVREVQPSSGNGRPSPVSVPALAEGEVEPFLERGLQAVNEMDTRELEQLLYRAAMAMNPVDLVERIMVPLLARIGMLWEEGEVGPASEHVASAVVRRFLDWVLETLGAGEGGPVLVVGTPQGQRHEFGALLAAVMGAAEGWSVVQLGPDLPAAEIADAARRKKARVVALSALHRSEESRLRDELLELRAELPEKVDVLIGGPAVLSHRDELVGRGIVVLEDLAEFREQLHRAVPARTNGDG